MKFSTSRCVFILLLLITLPALAIAQATNGSIRGTVADPTGAVMPKANVAVKNVDTQIERKLVTRDDGTYIADNLPPGEYEVSVEAQGFQKQLKRVTVQTANNVDADFSMTVGASTETVVISSEAAQVNTSDYKVDGVITRERIENLPLNGRSFLSLASLEPGVDVTFNANPGAGGPNNYFRVSIAGSTQSLTRISVDGANVNDRVTGGTSQNFSQETVQEFQITTFNFDLSVGNTSSGAVNIVSRTGGNQFHGSGFFFFRDHNIAAYPALKRPNDPSAFNPGFNDPNLRERLVDPFFVRRNMGVNMSGPIKKDKLFFFSNFEYTNQVGAQTISFTNPLFAPFSHVGQLPFRGKLFNTRLDYKVNSKHNAYLRYSQDVNTNLAGGGNLESTWTSSRNYAFQANLGVTSILTPRIVNEFRYSYSYYSNQLRPPDSSECSNPLYCFNLNGPRIGGFGLTIGNDNNVTQHRILRNFQLNENLYWQKGSHRIRFGGNWEHYYFHGSWARIFQGTFNLYSPETLLTQNPTLYAALPATLRTTTAGPPTFADILSLPVNGSISVSVGDAGQPPAYNFDKASRNNGYRLYYQDTWQIRPKFSFSYGMAWSYDDNVVSHDLDKPEYLRPVLGGPNADLSPTRHDRNNFQPAIGFAWTIGNSSKTVIRGGTGIYHASPNSLYTKLGERGFLGPAGNGLVPFNSALVPNPTAGQTIPGVPAQPVTLNFTQPTTFSGQNAIAVIPGVRGALASRWGTGQDLSIRGVEVTKQALGAAGEGIFMSDLTTGYTYQVTAGVQREITRNMILTADFVMRRGVKFGGTEAGFGVDINRFLRPRVTAVDPITQAVTFVQNPIIPVCANATQLNTPKFPCSSSLILGYWSGISTRYTGLLMKLDRRFSNGWQFTASYALSRYWLNTNENVNQVSMDNLYETAGIGGGDRPHRFTFSGFYELPTYKGDSRFLRGLLNSWQVGLISDMRSAPPVNPNIGLDVDGDGISRYTLPGIAWNSFGRGTSADEIREAVAKHNADVSARAKPLPANATAAQIAACTLFVDGQRMCGARTPQNQVIPLIRLPDNFSNGDPFYSQDLRLTRFIQIREKIKLSLIAEAFNLFNIANLTSYGEGLNALAAPGQTQQATFGQAGNRVNQIFGTGGPRAYQFAARLTF
ncbi:MAG: carboxypeptidase regulatory-like domain-containing protein [Acidobacteria bacterium]|nr:carboxypeptidase regulatory-like domain-containing protein [Acidobacteriota bacterium]